MSEKLKDLFCILEGINWFQRCGEIDETKLVLENAYLFAEDEKKVGKYMKSMMYENKMLDEMNNLHAFYFENEKVMTTEELNEVKLFCENKLKGIVLQKAKEFKINFEETEYQDLRSNVIGIAKAYLVKECEGNPSYYLDVLKIYQIGHMPCGWTRERGRKIIVY